MAEQKLSSWQDVERVFSNHEKYFWPRDGGTLTPVSVVNNQDWYENMNILDFLTSIGRYFRVGTANLQQLQQIILCIPSKY
jgi:tyrosyl-tRNA synthetase